MSANQARCTRSSPRSIPRRSEFRSRLRAPDAAQRAAPLRRDALLIRGPWLQRKRGSRLCGAAHRTMLRIAGRALRRVRDTLHYRFMPFKRRNAPFESSMAGHALASGSEPVSFKNKDRQRETRDVQTELRHFAPWKSLRPMRTSDSRSGLDRSRAAPHRLSLALPRMRLPVRGGGVLR